MLHQAAARRLMRSGLFVAPLQCQVSWHRKVLTLDDVQKVAGVLKVRWCFHGFRMRLKAVAAQEHFGGDPSEASGSI